MNDIKEKNEPITQDEQEMGSRYIIIKIAVIFALCFMVIFGITHPSSILGTGKVTKPELSGKSSKSAGHDFVSGDGKTVDDFSDAVITKSEKEAKLEVYSQDVSDTSHLSQNIIFNWLKKYKTITYKGKVQYYVDLNLITEKNVTVDSTNKTVTVTITKPQYQINLDYKDFVISDPSTHTFLPTSDIKLSFDDVQELDEDARKKIEAKVEQQNNIAEAKQAGLDQTKEIYEQVIGTVDKNYTVNVEY